MLMRRSLMQMGPQALQAHPPWPHARHYKAVAWWCINRTACMQLAPWRPNGKDGNY